MSDLRENLHETISNTERIMQTSVKKNSVGRWAAAGMKNGCFGHVEVDSEQEILALTLNHASQLLDLCD